MSRRRSSRHHDGRPAFLRREFGGAPYWFIIAALVALLGIGLFVLVQMM
jgi:uncharacterized membrane protein